MDTELREVTVNGTVLHYQDQGSGPALVLVHGSMADYRNWHQQMAPFAQFHRVIAYSRRYHYPNTFHGSGLDYSPFLHAADLAALIENLVGEPVCLVGSSYGAFTALVMAIQRPDLVCGLVLGEPPILPWLARQPAGAALLDAFMCDTWTPARTAFEAGDLYGGSRAFIDGVLGDPVFDRLSAPARTVLLDNAPSLQAELAAPGVMPDLAFEAVGQVSVPALIMRGENSRAMFQYINDTLVSCLPHSQQVTIPGASHIMHQSNPRAYNQAALAFVASLSSTQ